MSLDKKRVMAVELLEEIGFTWNGTEWLIPDLTPWADGHRLTMIDLGDVMYHRLLHHGADKEPGNEEMWLAEAWDKQTDLVGRQIRGGRAKAAKV